ncbi:error-prone DNA polymerase [Inquilinus limosus]|uniref:error-prone DNA polymerase n=1 Tax=Inquilinus limosus TaxID=171674 RepID=UPI0004060562|nr:error-prone DNA polymerase [Inquilinus limosus]
MVDYAELQVTTNFSFLRGGSHPAELVETAILLGLSAIAVTDRNTLAGIVRGHVAANRDQNRQKACRIPYIVGCRLDFADAPSLLCYPTDIDAYGRLCRLLTQGNLRAKKGECLLYHADLLPFSDGQILVALPPDRIDDGFVAHLDRLRSDMGRRVFLAASHRYRGDDARRLEALREVAFRTRAPMVATNDVLYHVPQRRRLQDALTCIREHCTIDEAGWRLEANAERHLKTPDEMARLFRDHPYALERTIEIAERCRFDLDDLSKKYLYPEEITPDGEPPQDRLERLTWEGAARLYPQGMPAELRSQIERELGLIGRREYAPFFLTVADIVAFANSKGILNQGRGSAANSAVCYCLGITAVNPTEVNLLFERFISEERHEPPDIDVDFEHERREEVIQHIYEKFSRDRAALTATVICYRTRGALRDVGKAMGLSEDMVSALTGSVWGWSMNGLDESQVREAGLDPDDPRLRLTLELAVELMGFPRHLSQHTGGFVFARKRLDELVPIENAAMEDRTVICWDKDDIEALGMLKVDVLALGMLSALKRCFDLLHAHYPEDFPERPKLGRRPTDEAVFDMLGRADSIGVFQVESRAQQSMLPRLKPKTYYDLVIEVAIVRPGPIQGDMVHPYLRRRDGLEPITYPKEELREVLEKTKGVPLFQEQGMKLAIVAAKFSPAEADSLRRAMATFKNEGTIGRYEKRFVEGMVANGYERDFAERCFNQIKGFGSYGFPEAHAASFALLVYESAWVKHHYPDVFCCALINSQPMGFYAPAQLVRDAREHGVEIRPVDVNHSDWDCTLEPIAGLGPDRRDHAVRLGLRLVKGLNEEEGKRIAERRGAGYASPADLARRAGVSARALNRLAEAAAFGSMGLDRQQGLWAVAGVEGEALPLFAARPAQLALFEEQEAELPPLPPGLEVLEDYAATGLSLTRHPLALLRPALTRLGIVPARSLREDETRDGARIRVAGIVLFRQRPQTANDTIFVTVEDESGAANIVVWSHVAEQYRRAVYAGRLLACEGRVQKVGEGEHMVIHVVAERFVDWTDQLPVLARGTDQVVLDPAPQSRPRTAAGRGHRVTLKSRDFR